MSKDQRLAQATSLDNAKMITDRRLEQGEHWAIEVLVRETRGVPRRDMIMITDQRLARREQPIIRSSYTGAEPHQQLQGRPAHSGTYTTLQVHPYTMKF